MHHTDATEQHLQELELCLLQPDIRTSKRVEELLAEDFIEVSSTGSTHTRQEIINALQSEPTTRWTTSQLKVRMIAPDVALVTFNARRHSEPPVLSVRSSIWRQRDGQWQMCFHQGTLTQNFH